MGAKGIKRNLSEVLANIDIELSGLSRAGEPSSRENLYARGLASEGYAGGYRDAISDVLLALNGVSPSRRGWWRERCKSEVKP